MHHQIDSLAYTNHLRSLPPGHKLGFAIALFILGYLSPPPLQLLITLWLMVWVVVYAKIPAKIYLNLLALPVSFWLLSLPALIAGVSLNSHSTTVEMDALWGVQVGPLYLYCSQQGLDWASIVFTRAITLTSCLYFILLTVPFVEIIRVLRQLRCPTLITELLSLMYRFIFVLTETVLELLTAQQSRNGYAHWRVAWRSISLVVGQLLWRTLENYRQIALGLQSRGFNGELRVWHARRYQPNWRYIQEAIGGYCLLLLLLVVSR
ncbi:cobalt ECF transporter T component CbiQ [Spirulina sp. CS-785/01]|uniref:cobalt ECF transporter T component CbiQ n=1 Tax=Spirulina sp. CS-785/01 TaxID=3021716 RepID=UPI00232B27E3|nr:cobalt ECF transporter T component CbiQ [Spirulina sp. CS-785/01]MDB9314978.1 cobalt ECF transporter T component CbiQ [Spirulina sp. CS-785/01]